MSSLSSHPAASEVHLPKGPARSTLWDSLSMILNPMDFLDQMRSQYGELFLVPGFGRFPEVIMVNDPKAIQQIFTADENTFDSGVGLDLVLPLVGDNSLILLDGNRHKQQRKLLMPPFHGERMRNYGELICNIADQAIARQSIGKTFLARETMQEVSLETILRAVFGLKEGDRYQQILQLLTEMLDSFNSPFKSVFLFFKTLQKDLGPWSPWGNFLRKRELLDRLLYQEIQERRAQGNFSGEDILSLLLNAQDEEGQPMSDVELRDELMTLLFAGHETTATALAWALYWLHYRPDVREKLLQELQSIDIKTSDPTAITRLPYLNAVCSETLRIYPVLFFAFPRVPKQPMPLVDYQIPEGMMLTICIYLLHHNPEIYPDPKTFKPERFLDRQYSPYEYIPFGGGNRRCLGAAFALFEMKLVLATVMSHYSLELINPRPIFPARRGVTFAPAGDIALRVTQRK
ncbi:cytochrome P450 [Laspinema palackyanum]|uniref:cytochrome P450 n=1 Tax=Laspinema palackyanum TaxID=3231601 RepID=UPI00345CC538|nr:cytochrome P450 [Laspinema sp. D2c]